MRSRPVKLLHSFGRRAQYPSPTCIPTPQQLRSRAISIQATPSSLNPSIDASPTGDLSAHSPSESPDARFEVLGSNSSLLSVVLAASQTLYTRRGTLAGVSGSPENATSTLSPLSPLTRGVVGIPFLYQKVSSPTPLNLLIAAKAPHTSFSVLHLDGRLDWIIAQRAGLVAWTGHSLTVKPRVNYQMTVAHWGNSLVTGRGLVALAASGNTYQITLKPGEDYVAHPSNVLAYTMNSSPPQPYRFKSSTFRFQIPSLRSYLPDSEFLRTMRGTAVYKFLANALFTLRTWTRRTIWADRLFLQFQGPATVLLQSRGSRIRDVLTSRDVNEIADSPAGVIHTGAASGTTSGAKSPAVKVDDVKVPLPGSGPAQQSASSEPVRADDVRVPASGTATGQQATKTTMTYANVGQDGKVAFSKS